VDTHGIEPQRNPFAIDVRAPFEVKPAIDARIEINHQGISGSTKNEKQQITITFIRNHSLD
jgi:hypothetical protein